MDENMLYRTLGSRVRDASPLISPRIVSMGQSTILGPDSVLSHVPFPRVEIPLWIEFPLPPFQTE